MQGSDAQREANRALVQRAMDGISALDVGAVSACLHDDLAFDLPYERAVERLDKAGFLALLRMMFDVYERFTISITRTEALESPNRLVAWYEGDCLSREGTPYRNVYVGFFEVRDRLLVEWTEYDNPLISQEAFAASEPS